MANIELLGPPEETFWEIQRCRRTKLEKQATVEEDFLAQESVFNHD